MSRIQNVSNARLLTVLGGSALVIQLLVFQNSFGIVENTGVSGLLRDVLSGGLLFVAVGCLVGRLYLRHRDS
ncbi:hypothetical protein E6P09_14070 [Haloferax mediterranei ATCC 33500]|uniref:Uncharacterized protein n=1 Tax=Haloferax mediterranei (strain ATCC 33500 / DSM 1411 / JCM 8866 / NBRC 14739 / NCIMB 2177 / R-4) TaxID=523841 RepID=A0A4P8P5X5_HALMT|nr:hypothetical protein E6P09_14070 [Haloferax mediterranei ATCC 33500]